MKKVLVVGDTILDEYVYGSINRVNPEAPYSVVLDYESREFKLGGACNVAINIRTLSKDADIVIHYYGAVSPVIKRMFAQYNIATKEETHEDDEILLKTRFINDNHHLLRLDQNKKYNLTKEFFSGLADQIKATKYDLVVLSDYNKGTIDKTIVSKAFHKAEKVLYDIKSPEKLPIEYDKQFPNVVLKCNKKEWSEGVNTVPSFNYSAIVRTEGKDGFTIMSNKAENVKAPQNDFIKDVVGAGDVFLAGMAVNYLETGDWQPMEMCRFGNRCAAEKVKHFGTYAIKREEIK